MSPSDDGNLFIWHYASGRLAAVLPAGSVAAPASSAGAASSGGGVAAAAPGGAPTACVAPHPLLPVLASGGADSVVRLWSPEAEQQCNLQHAAAAVQANLERLAEGGMLQQLPDGVLLGGGGGSSGGGRAPVVLHGP